MKRRRRRGEAGGVGIGTMLIGKNNNHNQICFFFNEYGQKVFCVY
jgi:hypothetical protein